MDKKSRGLRLNNPGNIRKSTRSWGGEIQSADKEFCQFRTLQWGLRAMFVLLKTYIVGYKLHDIWSIINRWAPPTENNTKRYIETVCKLTGRKAFDAINLNDKNAMKELVSAIVFVEQGIRPHEEDLETAWKMFYTTYHYT